MGMTPVAIQEEKPNWFYRRVIIFGTLIFSAVALTYLIAKATSDPLREELALGILSLDGAVITGYVFGAVWDDANFMKHRFPTFGMQGQMPGYGSPMGMQMPGMGMMPGSIPASMPGAFTPTPAPVPPALAAGLTGAPPATPLPGPSPPLVTGMLAAMKRPRSAAPPPVGSTNPNEGVM